MNRAEWLRCFAAVVFLFITAFATAQESAIENFREVPEAATPTAKLPVAERSVLAGGMALICC